MEKNNSPRGYLIWLKFTFIIFLMMAGYRPTLAQNYANGTGTGSLQNSVFWLTWTNGLLSQPVGSNSSIVTPGVYSWQFTPGVKVIATVSNINPITPRSSLRPYTSNASQDGLGKLYPGLSGTGLRDSLFAANIKFDISVDLQMLINGTWKSVAYPGLVVADAETLATDPNFTNLNEYIRASLVDVAANWQLLDFRKESYSKFPEDYKVAISNGGKDFKAFIDNSINTQDGGDHFLQAVMFAKNAKSLANVQTQGRGYTAVALGVVLPFDFGDAPSSFGNAGSYIGNVSYNNPPKLVDSVYTAMNLSQISIAPYSNLYMGGNNVDADGNPPQSTNALIDNVTQNNDEDGFSQTTQPGIYVNNANNLFLNVTATNKQASPATVYAWVDFDGNGQFANTEFASATVSAGASNTTVKLTFDYGKFGKIIKPGTTYARFRITTTKLLDNPATVAIDERSTSVALDGETEDYKLNDITFGNITKPIGVDDLDSTPINTPVITFVRNNDTINSYNATLLTNPPSFGTVVVNPDGSITYTPNSNFTGVDTYTYTLITPAGLVSDPINVVVFVKPTGVNDSVLTPINTPILIKIKLNDGVAEVNNVVTDISTPSNGVIVLNFDSTVTYTPSTDFVGLDTFYYKLTTPDNISSLPIMVIVKVVPLGVDDLDSTFINKPVTTIIKSNDGNGTQVDTVKIVNTPTNGNVKVNKDGTATYTPSIGFTGKDTYTYTLTDATGLVTHPITVTVLVKPIGVLDRDTTIVNNPITLDVKSNDSAKGGKDSVLIVTYPQNGTITVNADNSVTFTPNTDFIGKDTCYYTLVTADSVSSAPIPVYLTVTPQVKKADISIRKTLDTQGKLLAGEMITFTLNVTNNGPNNATGIVTKDTLANNIGNVTIVSIQNGTANFDIAKRILVWNIGNLSNGQSTSLTFKTIIDSGSKVLNTAYVSSTEPDPVIINNYSSVGPVAIQLVPVGVPDLDSTLINNPISTTVKTNDGIINLKDTIKVAGNPNNGLVVVNIDGTVTYTPNKGYTGKDYYTYTLTSDSGIVSQPISVNIKVKPVGVLDRDTTLMNTAITLAVKTNDSAQGGNNTVKINSNPKNGTVKVNADGTVTYTPNKGFAGNDTCYYTLVTTDGVSSAPIPVYLLVVPPPKKADITVKKVLFTTGVLTVGESIGFTISVTNKGPDDATSVVVRDTLTKNISDATIAQVKSGTANYDKPSRILVWNIGSLPSNQSTVLTFTTIIDSGKKVSNTAFVTANEIDPDTSNNHFSIEEVPVVTPVIIGVNDLDSTIINVPVSTPVKANDSTKNALDTVKVTTNPVHGTAIVNKDGTVTYTPATGYVGKDVYYYTLTDARNIVSDPITVNVLVKPVGVNDKDSTEVNKPVTTAVTANDGASVNSCNVQIISQPTHGKLVLNANNTVTYIPDSGYVGNDAYKYVLISADSLVSAPINVAIKVTPAVIRSADLSLVKELTTTGNLTFGQMIGFSITVINNGPDDATGVVVSDVLQNNLESPTDIFTAGKGFTTYDNNTRKLIWNVGSLPSNQVAALTFNTIIDSGSYLNNLAIVKGNEPDPDTTNNWSAITPKPIYSEDIFIPNVITPNGDGKNDKFVVKGLARYPNSSLSIFNRWDNMVYTTSDYQNDWDGAGLSSGTYYYLLKIKLASGKIETKKGWVMVIK